MQVKSSRVKVLLQSAWGLGVEHSGPRVTLSLFNCFDGDRAHHKVRVVQGSLVAEAGFIQGCWLGVFALVITWPVDARVSLRRPRGVKFNLRIGLLGDHLVKF